MKDKEITYKRMREIFESTNTNLIKEIKVGPIVKEPMTHCSELPYIMYIKGFYRDYYVFVGDADYRYHIDGINLFIDIVNEYKDTLNIVWE